MTKTDIGLKLLSLYRAITKARYNNDSGRLSEDLFEDSDTSTVEGMTVAILSSLDSRDFDEALTLLNDWVMNYPLEKEVTSLYNYLRAEYHLRLLDGEEVFTETLNNLNEAIDSANSFYFANKSEGHAMDDVAKELSDRLKCIIKSINQDDLKDMGLTIMMLDEPSILHAQSDLTDLTI